MDEIIDFKKDESAVQKTDAFTVDKMEEDAENIQRKDGLFL